MAPAGKTPETGTGPCGGIAISPLQFSGAQERCPVGAFKETDGKPAPKGVDLPTWQEVRGHFSKIVICR